MNIRSSDRWPTTKEKRVRRKPDGRGRWTRTPQGARDGLGAASSRLKLLIGAILASLALLCVAASSASAQPLYGLQFSTFTTDGSEWEAIGHSGASVYRLNATWKVVSDAGHWPDSPAWEQTYDKYFELAANHGITILPDLYGRRTEAAIHQFYLSTEWGEYLEFVWTFVQRYGRGGYFWKLHPSLPYKPALDWEVWNEPNLPPDNPGGTVLPQKYAEFLIATSNTIKSAQSGVLRAGEPNDIQVLHGGLYQPDAGTSVWSFMEKASKVSGYASSFNGLSLHPYWFQGNESEKITGVENNIGIARAALNEFAGTAKTLWITELGWPVAGTGKPSVSAQEQANLLKGSFDWIKSSAETYKTQLVPWYFYKDTAAGVDGTWDQHAGLRDFNGNFRPAWSAYQAEAGAPHWPNADELGFLRYNSASTHLDTYVGGPTYKTLGSSSDTGYPKITDPQNIQGMAIDTNGDGIDELGFVRYNAASNNTHVDSYEGGT